MALLKRQDLINRYNKRQIHLLSEAGEVKYAKDKLVEFGRAFLDTENYDVFLSHSYDDARLVKIIVTTHPLPVNST